MQPWQLDFEWLRVRHYIKEAMEQAELPSLNAILLLIGIQEYGHRTADFTKEEKQDLMHVAVCTLLAPLGYYTFEGRDGDGWPHYEAQRPLGTLSLKEQEQLLKSQIVAYFADSMTDA